MCTAMDLEDKLPQILHGEKQDSLSLRTRIRCKVKSTFSETRLVPALNDLLIANPSPAAVSRFRLGWLSQLQEGTTQCQVSTMTRFAGIPYDVSHSLNIWSSGMWVCTSTGSSAAMAAAGGQVMKFETSDLQYLIRYVYTHLMGETFFFSITL
jgi:NAD+ kinase